MYKSIVDTMCTITANHSYIYYVTFSGKIVKIKRNE